jgi:hypothetical protein
MNYTMKQAQIEETAKSDDRLKLCRRFEALSEGWPGRQVIFQGLSGRLAALREDFALGL